MAPPACRHDVVSSCADLSDEHQRLAEAHEAAARQARATAANYARGERGESVVRQLLEELSAEGWTIRHDRRWPGRRRANLDHVLIGPGGVLVLDTKFWRSELSLRHGRLYRGQADATDAVEAVLAQVVDVEEALTPEGLAPLEVVGALVFVGKAVRPHVMGRVHLLDEAELLRWVRARGRRLTAEQVCDLVAVVDMALEPAKAVSRPLAAIVRPRAKPASTMRRGTCSPPSRSIWANSSGRLSSRSRAG